MTIILRRVLEAEREVMRSVISRNRLNENAELMQHKDEHSKQSIMSQQEDVLSIISRYHPGKNTDWILLSEEHLSQSIMSIISAQVDAR